MLQHRGDACTVQLWVPPRTPWAEWRQWTLVPVPHGRCRTAWSWGPNSTALWSLHGSASFKMGWGNQSAHIHIFEAPVKPVWSMGYPISCLFINILNVRDTTQSSNNLETEAQGNYTTKCDWQAAEQPVTSPSFHQATRESNQNWHYPESNTKQP